MESHSTYFKTRNWLWSRMWFSIIFIEKLENFIVVFIKNVVTFAAATTK